MINDAICPSSILDNESSGNPSSPFIPNISNVQNTPPIISDLDVPIAIRKGIRTCTKYSITNYISYAKLSISHKALTTRVDKLFVSRNTQKALDDPN